MATRGVVLATCAQAQRSYTLTRGPMVRFPTFLSGGVALSTVLLAMVMGHEVPAWASLVKATGSPPLNMPNVLALEGRSMPGDAIAPANTRGAHGSCAASAIRLPVLGTRLVTARHCANEVLEVFDEQHRVEPTGRTHPPGDVDIALLDVAGKLPWGGLEPRAAATLEIGERLCAWRIERKLSGLLARERICARLLRTLARASAAPLLVLSHPYPRGTSGSALVDRDGKVVGVVVASTGEEGLAEPI